MCRSLKAARGPVKGTPPTRCLDTTTARVNPTDAVMWVKLGWELADALPARTVPVRTGVQAQDPAKPSKKAWAKPTTGCMRWRQRVGNGDDPINKYISPVLAVVKQGNGQAGAQIWRT